MSEVGKIRKKGCFAEKIRAVIFAFLGRSGGRAGVMKGKELLKVKAPFLFVTGPAGSGKTYLCREALNLNPKWGCLCATTGVAARVLGTNVVNGDVKTVHSTVGFFDVESIRNSRDKGTLRKNLKRLRKKFKRLVIDESSMLHSEIFEILVIACEEVGMGIVLTGDFLQLPAIQPDPKPKDYKQWLFEMPAWKKFKDNVIRLDTQYRHNDADFLKALNLLRAGKGEEAIPHLKAAGVKFVQGGVPIDLTYKGTTLVGTNNLCDKINHQCYIRIQSDEHTYTTKRSGFWTTKEWQLWPKDEYPDSVSLKFGTRVMILRNLYGYMINDPAKKVDTDTADTQPVLFNPDGSIGVVKVKKESGSESESVATEGEPEGEKVYTILQANGDTGVIESMGFDEEGLNSIDVRRDDGALLRVEPFKSDNGKYHTEIGDKGQRIRITDEEPTAWITYLPVKRAWAITTHKAQGLTIAHPTRILCEDFFGKVPAMVYVAASRVKNPTDLTIVGADYPVNGKPWLHWLCKADPAVKEWIDGAGQANAAKVGA
jgi:hypothetical protein